MMEEQTKPKVQCSYCGKITAPRLPKQGDGTFYYPRRHNIGGDRSITGKPCPGNIIESKILF